jgi:hypothetical protein
MTPKLEIARVSVAKRLGRLLMLRRTVAPLFQRASDIEADRIVFDFSDVEFMSRSFAAEYLSAKANCNKQVGERNVPPEVRRMMALVSTQVRSSRDSAATGARPLRRPRAIPLSA